MACGGVTRRRTMGRTRRCTIVGSGGVLPADDGRSGYATGYGTQDDHDRRDLSQGAQHGFQPAGKKGEAGRLIGRTKGGMNTKLHAVTDANGRPLSFFMTAGQVSDYIGAAALLDELPKAQWLLADRGYDADWFRDALQAKGITSASRAGNPGTSPSNTTNAATRGATSSRSCSVASRTSDGSRHATIDDQRPSSRPLLSPPPSSSGSNQ